MLLRAIIALFNRLAVQPLSAKLKSLRRRSYAERDEIDDTREEKGATVRENKYNDDSLSSHTRIDSRRYIPPDTRIHFRKILLRYSLRAY